MKQIIKTKDYTFSINLQENESNCDFEIIAFCDMDKSKSSITNLNFIISELIEPIITFEDYETTIEVNKNIGNKIYNEAIGLFENADWVKYLYVALEDDRSAGEWS